MDAHSSNPGPGHGAEVRKPSIFLAEVQAWKAIENAASRGRAATAAIVAR